MNNHESDAQVTLEETFPILATGLYANHAAMSPWPLDTQLAVTEFARQNAEHGPAEYRQWLKLENGLRERLARLLNAPSARDISLLRNTSGGVNIVAGGLDWKAGDNLVTPLNEFPSNAMAWDALQQRGVEIRRVDIRTAEDPEAALVEQMDSRTRVLTVSSVQWNDGFRLNLSPLGQACRTHGVLFFVDAIQQFGALPLDVEASVIDCLSAGSHKWQLGPEGMGVFYCRAEVRERLALQQWGWRMLDDPYRFDRSDHLPSRSGRCFEPGSPNTMGQVALDASLGVLERFGLEHVGEQVLANTRQLLTGLGAMPGVDLVSRWEDSRLSGIVSFACARDNTPAIYRHLAKNGLVCALREGAIRLSPHFYQRAESIARMLNAVENAVKVNK